MEVFPEENSNEEVLVSEATIYQWRARRLRVAAAARAQSDRIEADAA